MSFCILTWVFRHNIPCEQGVEPLRPNNVVCPERGSGNKRQETFPMPGNSNVRCVAQAEHRAGGKDRKVVVSVKQCNPVEVHCKAHKKQTKKA